MHDPQKVAEQLAAYMSERARTEGLPMELDAELIERYIRNGVVSLFGVEWQGDHLIRDWQEPEPGFFEAWLARRQARH